MKTNRLLVFVLLVLASGCATSTPTKDTAKIQPTIGVNFVNATVEILLNDYSEKSGKRIEMLQGLGVYAGSISLRSEGMLTIDQYLTALEDKLKEHNIGLYPIETNRLVATWIDPSKATPSQPQLETSEPERGATSYVERMRARRAAMQTQPITPPKYTGEELQKHLQEYNMELIRAAASGKSTNPPLPIPLTPEQDAQLVKEGILPPQE